MSKRIIAGVLGLAMVLSLVGVTPASAQTSADLQAQIASLLAQIQMLQAQLSGSTGGTTGGSYNFTQTLTIGSRGSEVVALQEMLVAQGHLTMPAGVAMGYFGPLTRSAVAAWQMANGVSPAVGYFGPISRAKANSMGGGTVIIPPCPIIPPGPTTGGSLSVSAGSHPANTLAPASAARVPFTRVMLMAGSSDVTVNSLTVQRQGLAQDENFTGVVLLDEMGTQIGIAKTLNTNHQAVVGEAFVVKAGTSKTVTVAGNIAAAATANSGEIASFAVIAVNVGSGATVSGSLPIVGASHTINTTLTIGTLTNARGPIDPNSAVTKNVGTVGYTFSSLKITAGSQEDLKLNSVRWNQASSSGASDLANVKTVVDGVEYPTTISADGKYFTSVFGSGIPVLKGNSAEISIKGDIVGGSGRTIAFNIEKTTDLNVIGQLYGYGITPATSGTGISSGNIWFAASTVTIAAGSITVENSTTVGAQSVAINLANQPLGGFKVTVQGEAISISALDFTTSTSSGATSKMTNISIVDENGAVVAGPVDQDDQASPTDSITFSDTIIFPVGTHTYTIKGKIPSGWSNSSTVAISTQPSVDWTTVTGQSTGNTITPSSSTVTMNTMTVKAAALTVSVAATPTAQTVVAGANQFTFANYQLDATASGEDLRLNTFPVEYNTGSTASNLTQCNLYDGTAELTTGSNTKNPAPASASSTSFTLDAPLIVAKGTVKTIALKCNIASGATGTYAWGYDSSATVTATGVTSGQSATITEVDSAGQLMTLASAGTLAVALESSPTVKLVSAGTTGNTLGTFRLTSTREDIRVEEMAWQLTNTASSSASDIVKVTIWDGSTSLGEVLFTGTNTLATSTISGLVVPKDGSKIITLKGDFTDQGTTGAGTPGAFVSVDWDATALIGTSGTGLASGQTIEATDTSTTDTAVVGVRVLKSVPTFEQISMVTANGIAGGGRRDLYKFKITASPQGEIGIYHITFRISTSSSTALTDLVDNINLYAYKDSGYSSIADGLQADGSLLQSNLDLSTLWVSASTDLVIGAQNSTPASTTVKVLPGTPIYFVLRGDITPGAATSYSVTTQLQGDAKFVSGCCTSAAQDSSYLSSSTAIDSNTTHNDFIWRPFSTSTTQDATINDYLNGFTVPGLPDTNTNVQSLTQ